MPFIYRVGQGDCLSSIAAAYRFAWRTIYDHPQNADFKRKRPNPNIIFPGDSIFIPDHDAGQQPALTDQKHVYVLNRQPVTIRICIEDQRGVRFFRKQYKLKIEDRTFEGTTGSDGLIEQEIPPTAKTGELTVWLEDDDYDDCTWNLNIGSLDPIEEISGVQGRLNNLGYICGPVDGIAGQHTLVAVSAYQAQVGMTVTGKIDEDLLQRLVKSYDKM